MSSLIGIYKKHLANVCIFINREAREGVISAYSFFSMHICIYAGAMWTVVFLAPPVVTLLDLREQLCVFVHGT